MCYVSSRLKWALANWIELREGLLLTHAGRYWKFLQLTRTSGKSKENSIKPFNVVFGTRSLYDKFDKCKATLKSYGHSDSLLLLMLRFILRLVNIIVKLTNELCRFYKMSWFCWRKFRTKYSRMDLVNFEYFVPSGVCILGCFTWIYKIKSQKKI